MKPTATGGQINGGLRSASPTLRKLIEEGMLGYREERRLTLVGESV